MSRHFYWGQDITYKVFVMSHDDVDDIQDLSDATDNPSIYLFDEKPTRAVAAAGTGALATISSWTDTSEGGKQFTIAAIDDPDTDDADSRETYWLGINFTLQNSEQVQTILRALPMCRAVLAHDTPGVTKAELQKIYSAIGDLKTDAEITNAIDQAESNVRAMLQAVMFDYALIWCKSDLKDCIKYEALHILMESLVAQSGDSYDSRGDVYKEMRDFHLASIRVLKADSDNTEPVKEEEPDTGIIVFRR